MKRTGGAQAGINTEDCKHILVTLPPLSEQQEIASYLDQKCADIDAIIANCTAQIEKYKTLKRALINEVVTGQRTIE
jgi:type I restriction enzyme S subunit